MTEEAHGFLDELWPGKPAAAAIQLWRSRDKKAFTFDSTVTAARWAGEEADRADIYLAAGLAPKVEAPQKNRVKSQGVIGIPGLWADIDLNDESIGKTGAAPTMDVALELASAIVEPTILVHSGHGLQAWWLFEDPWLFALESEREQAGRLSRGFQAMLKAKARGMGFGVDSTHDLARLMRLPGTMNHKVPPPVPVTRMEHEGPRYTVENLSQIAEEFIAKVTFSNGGPQVEIEGEFSDPNLVMIDELKDADDEFRMTWERSSTGRRKNWGASEYDMAIANHLVNAGFTDQEIANAIVYHRRRHGDPKNKASRTDYIKLTISKARSSARVTEVQRRREEEVQEAVERMVEMADSEVPAAAPVTTSLFSKIVGGPEIKELIQDGRDPDMARYTLVFANGEELGIGTPADLLSFDRFKTRYVALTQHLPPRRTPTEWDGVVRSLLTAVQVREDDDSTREGQVASWVSAYLERRLSRDKDRACQVHDPFEKDEELFIPLASFVQWLRRAQGERVTSVDVKQLLHRVGFERRTVSYATKDEKRSSRSYYVGPRGVVYGGDD